ncbi:hypothetical protein CHLRE_12g514200v5 [Chlamydomonas reinhardtii]|uniref:Fatty acid photodecarboxylase, chloroplastic n=1 Tax=Chlamydomonas reinhardtii TaxID=3055 RepID=FAP_CHLRE|nr:uncharacterized protein CHLRE_12g514200v5 [Chlamydomonas reinhardtii]A8JHB7.1 RecName: Full=Fatty acid photodecarboxylase, chloroplastic; Short=CrFAP; Flags: Precursor [Chlamydomonas reinhardtii]PNW75136.1 hypothetical protein CHLRE_12g514200v5 [Chlamydomonas reinhardtii]|eukprot:XP_001703004.1 predicted protein [Chlamydomonas reinhardtii]
MMLGPKTVTRGATKGAAPRSMAARRVGGARRLSVRAAAGPAGSEKFDYVLVGGGTASCVLANKLSADGNKKVLVLEAGPTGDAMEVAVPAGITRLFAHPVMDWGMSSLTQKQLVAREIYLARGRMLGGSSGSNATLYHRGSAADYDAWGLEGWSSKDVLDWFVKAECYADGPKPYHGTGGSMNTEQPRYENVLHDEFFKAAAATGLPANPDFNDWSHPQDGFGEFQVSQKKGQRADTYRTYLKPAMARGNLKVVIGARATKVNIEKGSSGARTTGVEYAMQQFGDRFTAELAPGGEVLMCSGAVHTPHLLMLSGVGPAATLKEHGIDVVSDLSGVGQNLQDHPAAVLAARAKPEFEKLSVTSEVYDDKCNIKLGAVAQYLFQRRGPLATTGCDHGAFVRTSSSLSQPDLQMRFVPGCALDPDGVKSYIVFGELKKQGRAWPGGITLQLLAIRAKSKGSIGLKAADPFINPAININYFSDPADLATLVNAVKMARKIAAQEPLKKYLQEETFPGERASSDKDLEEYIRRTVHSGNALVGTAAMGASPAAGAVVSSADLKVFGVEGLRVVDASVLPRIPGGQTGAATVMVAERAAALLRGQATIAPSRQPVAV